MSKRIKKAKKVIKNLSREGIIHTLDNILHLLELDDDDDEDDSSIKHNILQIVEDNPASFILGVDYVKFNEQIIFSWYGFKTLCIQGKSYFSPLSPAYIKAFAALERDEIKKHINNKNENKNKKKRYKYEYEAEAEAEADAEAEYINNKNIIEHPELRHIWEKEIILNPFLNKKVVYLLVFNINKKIYLKVEFTSDIDTRLKTIHQEYKAKATLYSIRFAYSDQAEFAFNYLVQARSPDLCTTLKIKKNPQIEVYIYDQSIINEFERYDFMKSNSNNAEDITAFALKLNETNNERLKLEIQLQKLKQDYNKIA